MTYPDTSYRRPAQQDWSIGQAVKVGFLTLDVVEKIAGQGVNGQAGYRLQNLNNGKRYTFIPHEGLCAGWEF